jgi:molybdopterin-guanine dinucleotide biosynthesis protein A
LVSIAILAGGDSKRIGRDKAFIEVGGRSIIERILDCVKPLTDDVFISTNSLEKYASFGLRTVADVYPGKAALGGIYSALEAAHHNHVLVLACDMPFLNVDLLRYMIGLAPTADIIIPLIDPQGPEALHAIYSKNCLPAIKSRLQINRLRVVGFFDEVSVHYVKRDQVAKFDPNFYSFVNLNTPEDGQIVQSIAERLKKSANITT